MQTASHGSRPPVAALEAAESLLADLGATDEQGLTGTGRLLAALPLPPRIGRLLVEAVRLGCLEQAGPCRSDSHRARSAATST
jgi:HrpA-like RNA helicase